MITNVNLNPSFSNLAALHGLGGRPRPVGPVAPIGVGGYDPSGGVGLPMQQPQGMPMQQTGMPMQQPQGNVGNLRALMQMLGVR